MLNWIFTAFLAISITASLISPQAQPLDKALLDGAGEGVTLAISLAGPLCLWSGVGRLMDRLGLTDALARLLGPALRSLFPAIRQDPELRRALSSNVCANLLGLGNAATPPGIRAARRLAARQDAQDQLCRLVVLNTASIQLLPTSVAAVRSGLGSAAPFDILPAVWITSLLSAGLGLTAAWILGKLWPHG